MKTDACASAEFASRTMSCHLEFMFNLPVNSSGFASRVCARNRKCGPALRETKKSYQTYEMNEQKQHLGAQTQNDSNECSQELTKHVEAEAGMFLALIWP